MSDEKQYAGIIGFVFKDPEHSETKTGKKLRRITVSEANQRNGFYSVTVWDEQHGDVPLAAGDLVSAQGGYTEQTKDGKTFKNISAKHLVNLGSGVGNESPSSGQASPASSSDDPY